jgi:cation diffusion facilitator CzcD-associated flavoprotein CzcO
MKCNSAHVVVIGAGPYGLAAAAHLKHAGIETVVFGSTMHFWKNHMPAGMLLRSPWSASHIGDPDGQLTLDRYHAEVGIQPAEPVSLERFLEYGVWFQRRVVPELDQRQIVQIEKQESGFRLSLNDGDSMCAARVVIATGIGSFAYRPSVFDRISPEFASHSSDHHDFKRFARQQIIVVGRGQSALESAALLSQVGAEVEVVVRASKVRWLHARDLLRHPSNPLKRVFFHPTDVGPPLLTQIAARPHWFKLLPRSLQPHFTYRCIRPAGAAWLQPRMNGVKITTGRNILAAESVGNCLKLRLDDGQERRVDHVLLATGYRVDILRHRFIAGALAKEIRCSNGHPELDRGFESSVPGLHFLGAPAALTFGPLMRFVSGTAYSAAALTRGIKNYPRA